MTVQSVCVTVDSHSTVTVIVYNALRSPNQPKIKQNVSAKAQPTHSMQPHSHVTNAHSTLPPMLIKQVANAMMGTITQLGNVSPTAQLIKCMTVQSVCATVDSHSTVTVIAHNALRVLIQPKIKQNVYAKAQPKFSINFHLHVLLVNPTHSLIKLYLLACVFQVIF
jgi:hypothetical protein